MDTRIRNMLRRNAFRHSVSHVAAGVRVDRLMCEPRQPIMGLPRIPITFERAGKKYPIDATGRVRARHARGTAPSPTRMRRSQNPRGKATANSPRHLPEHLHRQSSSKSRRGSGWA